jgi:uncharacterized protein YjbJ (UPF0337 family)
MPTQMERAKTSVRRAKTNARMKVAKVKAEQGAKGTMDRAKGTARDIGGGMLGKPGMKAKGKLQKAVGKARSKIAH